LWKSDGTTAGTVFVRSIPGSATYSPGPFIGADGKVIFLANDTRSGIELWVTDGSANGTQLIKDVFPATFPANPRLIGELNGRLYFAAAGGVNGSEPWSTDGTAAGTRLLRDIYLGSGHSDAAAYARGQSAGGYLYFTAYDGTTTALDQLWRTDGTSAGTIRLLTLAGRVSSWGVLGDTLYFTVKNAPGLWTSDGTPEGTVRISDADIAAIGPVVDGVLYCTGSDPTHGTELWRSNGTTVGTYLAAELRPGNAGSDPQGLTAVGDALFFFASDADGTSRLFKYTAAAGAAVVSDKQLDWKGAAVNSGGKFYFAAANADSGMRSQLWVSDGTDAGTRLVDPGSVYSPEQMIDLDGVVVFGTTDQSDRRRLFRSDGTAAGTYPLGDLAPGDNGSPSVTGFVRVGGTVYLADTRNGVAGLWQTDGTPARTLLAAVVNTMPGLPAQRPQLASVGDAVFFVGNDSVHGNEVWRVAADQPPLVVEDAMHLPNGALSFRMNRPAVDGLWTGGVSVTNLSTNSPIPAEKLNWAYDASGRYVINLPGGLTDGNYLAVLSAGATGDASGNPLASDFDFDFFVLAGDANQDRAVDFDDLVRLAQNYNAAGGKSRSDGDFTGDGAVDFNDLVILAQRYNTTLPPPPVQAASTFLPRAPSIIREETARGRFSTTPLARSALPQARPWHVQSVSIEGRRFGKWDRRNG
jgi:ELWxxDGT repeat protein